MIRYVLKRQQSRNKKGTYLNTASYVSSYYHTEIPGGTLNKSFISSRINCYSKLNFIVNRIWPKRNND